MWNSMRRPCSGRRSPLALALVIAGVAALPAASLAQSSPSFLRGDSNADGSVDISDATSLLGCLFLGGQCSECPDATDANDDGNVDLSDAVRVLSWLFLGGTPPVAPGPTDCGLDPTADRLATCSYPTEICAGSEVDPKLVDRISRLHYASRGEPHDDAEELRDVQEERIVGVFRPREVIYDPRPRDSVPWNSRAGRAKLAANMTFEIDPESLHSHATGSVEQEILSGVNGPACVAPDFFVSAGDRQFRNWTGVRFQAPANAFDTEGQARQYLLKVQAEQPFFLPYRHRDVRLGHGWYYNSGGLHRACDYSRRDIPENTDPTFEVHSAGSGVVVATGWDHNGGNYVAVESVAPGGQRIMFIYLHLRNGRTNDVANASSSTSTADKYKKYRAFASKYPEHISWGDDTHTLQVAPGDTVSAGEVIGWAGNTGAGGIAAGLDDEGNPDNWRGNTHLHVYTAAPHPTVSNTWVWVDPYGVYGEVDSGCYDLLKDTQFARLYAPFMPTFHGVPYEVFSYYFGYYPNMGRKLRTISVHRSGDQLLASGSFQSGIPGGWFVHGYMSPETFQQKAEEYKEIGYVPRELNVAKTLGGNPRYTALWRSLAAGEAYEHRGAMTTSEFEERWNTRVIDQEWRMDDYFGYSVGNTAYHSALFTNDDPRPFAFSGPISAGALDQMLDEMLAQGLVPVNFNVAWMNGERYYSALFRKVPGCWRLRIGASPTEYQELVALRYSQGYQIRKVQGYAGSTRFGVLFYKPDGCN